MRIVFQQILIMVILSSCLGTGNDCISKYDNDIPETIDEELTFAQKLIIDNIDSLQTWDVINKKLLGQKAGVLAGINLGLWNLIDGAYLESITIKNENLILFEYVINSCTWKKEYIIFNDKKVNYNLLFKNSIIKADSIQTNWDIVRIKDKQKNK